MKRPMLAVGLSFAAATWVFFFFGVSPLVASALCAVGGAVLYLARRSEISLPVALFSAALAFGLCYLFAARSVTPLERRAGDEVAIRGIVTQVQYTPPSYTLTVNASFPEETGLPGTALRVRGYGDLEYFPGDGLLGRVRLEELRSSQGYHHSQGVFMGARLVSAEPHTALSLPEAALSLSIIARGRMTGHLYANLPPSSAGVMAAMVLGERESLADDVADALNRSGTIHLVSVSGLHLSILIGCVMGLLARLKAGRRLRLLLGGVAALAFSLLVGLSPSIARALVMMLIWLLAQSLSQRSDSLNSLGTALILIVIFAPHWVLSRGLWLSFSSSAGISVLSPRLMDRIDARYEGSPPLRRRLAKLVLGAGAVSVSAYAFSLPILLISTGWVTLISPLANTAIAPLSTPALVCGMLCALFPAVPAPIAWVAAFCTDMIVSVSKLFAAIPFVVFTLDEGWRLVWVVLAFGLILLLIRFRAAKELRKCGALVLVLTFALGNLAWGLARRSTVELVAIEGCSPTILLREDSAVLIGTPTIYEMGRLTRYLEFRGVRQLDVILAYDQGDQIGSPLLRLVERYPQALVVGPDDAYVLGELAQALPDTEVYSAGYATLSVLGGVLLEVPLAGDLVRLGVGKILAVKSGAEYPEELPRGHIRIWKEGVVASVPALSPAWEPMGGALFGERRFVLKV